MSGTTIEHVDGIAWWDAPLPRRFHFCKAQTIGWLGFTTKIERCACGATRRNGRVWFDKNQTRNRAKR